MSSSIRRVPTDKPHVYAFEVRGEVQARDMEDMAQTMNDAFDRHDKVDMLIVFRPFDGAEASGAFDVDVIKSQFKSLTSVGKYAVVGAPGYADTMIELFGSLSPVDAETFDQAEEAAAWRFVGAQPA